MNIRITYPSGRIDVFDTGAYATSAPFDSKNMLTDFEIGLGDIEEEGLWLVANYYAAKPEFRKGAAGIPVARRMEIPTLHRGGGKGAMRRHRRWRDGHREGRR